MDWIYLFTSLNGRISRQTFWIGFAFLAAAELAKSSLSYIIESQRVLAIPDLVLTYLEFAVATKRANDRNLPPWVVALFFGISAALDLFILFTGDLDPQAPVVEIIEFPFLILAVILLIELGFRRGTEGPNRFGPDPLADSARR